MAPDFGGYNRDHLRERRLSAAIAADEINDFTRFKREPNGTQGETLVFLLAKIGVRDVDRFDFFEGRGRHVMITDPFVAGPRGEVTPR